METRKYIVVADATGFLGALVDEEVYASEGASPGDYLRAGGHGAQRVGEVTISGDADVLLKINDVLFWDGL